jgi:flagella basal body P-ring formation protein FlgA
MGQGVEIVASIGGITVKAEGRMLADAQLGDWVRVANLATDTVVQGTLTSPGIVLAGGRR